MWIQDSSWKTCRERWMIGTGSERESWRSVLATRDDDDDRKLFYISFWPIYRTLTSTTTPGQGGHRSNDIEGVIYIPQRPKTYARDVLLLYWVTVNIFSVHMCMCVCMCVCVRKYDWIPDIAVTYIWFLVLLLMLWWMCICVHQCVCVWVSVCDVKLFIIRPYFNHKWNCFEILVLFKTNTLTITHAHTHIHACAHTHTQTYIYIYIYIYI